jgi:hypothetical protein
MGFEFGSRDDIDKGWEVCREYSIGYKEDESVVAG